MPFLPDASRRLVHVILVSALLLGAPTGVHSQASPYVPTLDPLYGDLDALVRAGLVRDLVLGQRPYSRMTFARAAAEARGAVEGGSLQPKERFLEALSRLETTFEAELGVLCSQGTGVCTPVAPYSAMRGVALEVTGADSPARAMLSRYWNHDDFIDADVNPLLQRNRGKVLADGWTLAGEASFDLLAGSRVAAQVAPRLRLSREQDGGGDAEVTLQSGYARALLGNLSVDVGRNHVTLGHSRDLAPIRSGNPRPMDMIRVSMERPATLPWILRYIGPMSWTLSLSDMGSDQDTPHSKLVEWAGAIRPHHNLELGMSLMSHQGGEGAPQTEWYHRIRDVLPFLLNRRPFYWGPPGETEYFSDKILGFSGRLLFPGQGVDLYWEMATTDDHDMFSNAKSALWYEAAWTAGLRLAGLGPQGRFDVWAEGSHSGLRIYTHDQFSSGMTVDRRVLGSPLGPTAAGFQGGLDWSGPTQKISVTGAWERYRSDWWDRPPDSDPWNDWDWIVVQDGPDETRIRGTVDWRKQAGVRGVRTTARLGYERVHRFAFTDRNRSNWMAQLRLDYLW